MIGQESFHWRSQRHYQLKLYTDASSFAWGGVLNPDEIPMVAADYWPSHVLSSDIPVKEALALANVLADRIDVYVDSAAPVHAWNNQGARSHPFSDALKEIFKALLTTNSTLKPIHVSLAANLADPASRFLSLADAKLPFQAWSQIKQLLAGTPGTLSI